MLFPAWGHRLWEEKMGCRGGRGAAGEDRCRQVQVKEFEVLVQELQEWRVQAVLLWD